MKVEIKALIIGVIAVVLCMLSVILIKQSPQADEKQIDMASTPLPMDEVDSKLPDNFKSQVSNLKSNWPMFRGGQSLPGVAEGSLPDSFRVIWKFKTEDDVKSSPVIVDGLVFVGSSDENVYAIDLANGQKVWSYKTTDAVEATPCVVERSVYIGSLDGFLYALDAQDGSLRWKYKTDGQIPGAANWTRSPKGDIWILVGSYDNILHCLDSKDGSVIWTYETDNYINGSPAVDDQKTVFGGCDALIHVVSLVDGSKVAEIDSGSYIAASAAFLDGQVYVGNYENVFIRADIAAGKIIWEYKESDSPFFSSPAVNESVVVFGGRDQLVHCVGRKDGKVVWTFKTLDEVDSSPVICGDKVVIGSQDGRLYVLNLSDGTKVWSFETGQAITSSPAVAGGLVVIGCDDGYVYCFGAKQ
ncbi:MAG: PQQ-binding-like beta-propeller repeat protein [Sedimentisphaerales bacterium]|nr:PQQ-binding-like beta-propeller repeat protein [Sedimentisphaerales bacterium]